MTSFRHQVSIRWWSCVAELAVTKWWRITCEFTVCIVFLFDFLLTAGYLFQNSSSVTSPTTDALAIEHEFGVEHKRSVPKFRGERKRRHSPRHSRRRGHRSEVSLRFVLSYQPTYACFKLITCLTESISLILFYSSTLGTSISLLYLLYFYGPSNTSIANFHFS